MTLEFSSLTSTLGAASSIQQNELVYALRSQGKDPIILSYGEAPFSIDPVNLDEGDFDRGSHYSEGKGVPEFVETVLEDVRLHHSVNLQPDNILVSAGSKIISYFIACAFLNKGDMIALHEPSWVSYQEHAKMCGAGTFYIPADDDIADLFVSRPPESRIKLVYLNNPNNPRGHIYDEREIDEFVCEAEKNNIVVALDESYSDFANEKFVSGLNFIDKYRNVVVFHSMSKNFGLSGWRIGYAAARPDVINALNKFNQHLITCAPTNLQLALVGKLGSIRDQIGPQMQELKAKRYEVLRMLDKYGFKYLEGDSTFYIFIDLREYFSSTKEFVVDLLRSHGVSYIPGDAYGAATGGFVRLSFGVEPIARIEQGISILREVLENWKK